MIKILIFTVVLSGFKDYWKVYGKAICTEDI